MKYNRRTILKAAGATMALPWLESIGEKKGNSNFPSRVAFIYKPNGVNGEKWTPKDEGFDYTLSPTLEPLEKYKSQVSVFSNLLNKNTKAESNPDPHNVGTANLLSGGKALRTAGKNMRCGKSVDQVIADAWRQESYLPSIELSVMPPKQGVSNHGFTGLYGSFISWANDTTPIPREIYPRQAFDSLFVKRNRKGLSKNALDLFREQTKDLQRKLGKEDQPRLEEYLTTLHELEQRIKRNSDNQPPLPFDVNKKRPPVGKPSNFLDHFNMHLDIIALAFQSGRTRVASSMMGHATGGIDYSSAIESAKGSYHAISHHGGDKEQLEKYFKINRYHVKLYSELLKKLDSMPEGEGTVLDNTLVFMGSSMRDGNAHDHRNLPILLGGGKNILKLGEHKVLPKETPLCNLYTTMIKAMINKDGSFGDSNGRFDDILI